MVVWSKFFNCRWVMVDNPQGKRPIWPGRGRGQQVQEEEGVGDGSCLGLFSNQHWGGVSFQVVRSPLAPGKSCNRVAPSVCVEPTCTNSVPHCQCATLSVWNQLAQTVWNQLASRRQPAVKLGPVSVCTKMHHACLLSVYLCISASVKKTAPFDYLNFTPWCYSFAIEAQLYYNMRGKNRTASQSKMALTWRVRVWFCELVASGSNCTFIATSWQEWATLRSHSHKPQLSTFLYYNISQSFGYRNIAQGGQKRSFVASTVVRTIYHRLYGFTASN